MRAAEQLSIFDVIARKPYPYYAGAKVGGASMEAADLIEHTGSKGIWLDRCKALFGMRDGWTAEEGIEYWALKLKEDIRAVDKNLRPRFTDLTNTKPAFIFKSGERRGTNKVRPHVYKRAA